MKQSVVITATAVLVGLAIAVPLALRSARAGIDSAYVDDATLVEQLAQLMKIHDEMKKVSDGVLVTADAVDDVQRVYLAAQGGWEELAAYTTDAFVGDFKRDLYTVYPGFEILGEGTNSRRVKRWLSANPRTPATAYEMIGAVFGDVSAKWRDDPRLERAKMSRLEAAAALLEARRAEEWSQKADTQLLELADELADRDVNPGQSQVLSARTQAIMALQQSRIIRLLSRRVRTDGLKHAWQWADAAAELEETERQDGYTAEYFRDVTRPVPLMQFQPLFATERPR